MDDPSLNLMNARDKSEERLPPGFRFHPTDEELVTYYLTSKILDSSFSGRAITEVDLNKSEPWDLPAKAKMGEKEWYFFSLRDRKYPTGLRTNRATEAGYWKTTGKDREIFNSRTSSLVGMKKTLVFYKGRAPKGEKTNWVMHEYRLEGKFSYHCLPKNSKDEWVVCRIFQKSTAGGKKNSTGLGRISYLDLGSPSLPSLLESPYNATAVINEQETGSIESESGTSAKVHVSCFSTACMEAAIKDNTGRGLIGQGTQHHHVQVQQGGVSSSNPGVDSAELSDMARILRSSQNNKIMLNDPRFNINLMPAAALSSLRRDQSALYHQPPGMQHLPALAPPLLFSQMSSLPSLNSMGRGNVSFPVDATISAQAGLPSNAFLRAMINNQSAGINNNVSLKQAFDRQMDPSTSSYGLHADKSSTAKVLETAPAFHWINDDGAAQQQHQQQQISSLEGNGVSDPRIISSQQVGSVPHVESCLSTVMNGENMSSVVCNNNNNNNNHRPYDQVDPSSAAAPVDLESFWSY